ncbi:DEAD/DEAH box helicase [Candidatus Micrarchaeota archaeon]|nr:DEAD/DEAH box helicase [Candidatus Micrarchaeota archaeon]
MSGNFADFLSECALTEKADVLEAREYQINIAKSIISKGNSLVIMPTALGKTFVAILVIAKFVSEMLSKKRERKKFIFLAPTKPLAAQQAKTISGLVDFGGAEGQKEEGKKAGAKQVADKTNAGKETLGGKETENEKDAEFFGPRVVLMTGEIAPEKRQQLWGDKDVWCYVGTPQTLEFDLLAGRVDLNDFCMVVLDEAHRAVKEYSYSFVARESAGRNLLVVGLTASPSSNRQTIDEICSNLQIENIEIRDENDFDVKRFSNKIENEWVFVELPKGILFLRESLRALLKEVLEELKGFGALESSDLSRHTRELLLVRQRAVRDLHLDAKNYSVLSLQARAMNISHALDLVETQGVFALLKFMDDMKNRDSKSKAVRVLLEDFRWGAIEEKANAILKEGVEHPKFEALVKLLKNLKEGEKAIVFAQFRSSVKKIAQVLGEVGGLRPVEFVGKSRGLSQKHQQQVMQGFREEKFNILVSTSVGEEGLDVPEVGLVVFFESVPSEIRLIQRRGRTGRVRQGRVVFLITKGTKDEAMFWSSKNKEKKMRKIVEGLRKETAVKGGQRRLFDP